MKAPVPRPLTEEDLKPYMDGKNVVRYVIQNGETPDCFIGWVKRIRTDLDHEFVKTLIIKTEWLVRIRKLDDDSFDIIEGTFKSDYESRFESPQVVKRRSPLTLQCEGETVEVSHVTELSMIALDLKNRIEALN